MARRKRKTKRKRLGGPKKRITRKVNGKKKTYTLVTCSTTRKAALNRSKEERQKSKGREAITVGKCTYGRGR